MEPIKSFEAFIADAYKSIPANEEIKFEGNELQESTIPESARRKLWEFVHECMETAVLYEGDEDNNHTLEKFMTEAADMMASSAIKSLKQNKALISIAAKANPKPINEEDKKETKAKAQEYIKNRLDKICDNMLNGFTKGISNAKEDNVGIASLVASEMMKDTI
jgi:hypothetical protein